MNAVFAVLKKELIDGLRDRRSMMSAILFPMIGPLLISFMATTATERQRESRDVKIPIVGAEQAPGLVNWIERRGYEVVEGPLDPEAAVRDGAVDFVLIIPEDFASNLTEARTAEIELVLDSTKKDVGASIGHAYSLVESYGHMMGRLRLIARGISPQIGRPITVEEVDIASERQRAAHSMIFIPMYLIMAAFITGMNLAVDTTAGERERQSLEPLLINPVSRMSLLLGKWLSAVVFSCAGVVLTMASLVLAMRRVSWQELGIQLNLGAPEVAGVLLATLPLAFFASGAQVLVSSFARSFKEAQTYISLMIIVPMAPSIIAQLYSLGNEWWMAPIPVLGQQVLMTEVVSGEPVSLLSYAATGLSSLVLGLLCVWITARLFTRENVVFGR
ncbi:MAG: ABC transporter permease [Candidatus Latescibacterota bacterium]|nr:ABC transporter permease [Candidatus Latescibacterota bacterium]